MNPVAFSLGPFVVRWYALAYLSGFLLGWRYALHLVKRALKDKRPNARDIDDFLSWAVLAIILGGRVGYILFYNFEYYINTPLEMLKIWHGGMSFHGGVLGIIIALVLFSKRHKINMLRLSDIVCAVAPIGLFFGRIANFINAELYGRTTTLPWGVVFPGGGALPRHPSQLYEAALEGALLFLIMHTLSRNKERSPGVLTAFFLILYGIMRAGIEFVRAPDLQIGLIGGVITMGQFLCIPMIAVGLILLWIQKSKK